MKTSIRNNYRVTIVLLGILSLLPAAQAQQAAPQTVAPPQGMPFKHGLGFELFQDNCAGCHGTDLKGTDQGPPLLHAFYKPGHHSDAAFYRAITAGSPQHHWNFGDMPPVAGIDAQQAKALVAFVRWAQQDAGLY